MPDPRTAPATTTDEGPDRPRVCGHCDWRFVFPAGTVPDVCPHCFAGRLALYEPAAGDPALDAAPELMIPFTLAEAELHQRLRQFAGGIPFPPADLSVRRLQARRQPLFLPVWLVDADVRAQWRAEMGFDYDVISHQDRFDEGRGGWASREVRETRIRWEPRCGDLERTYPNIAAPALEEHERLWRQLGEFPPEAARPFDAAAAGGIGRRLPGRSPTDAWPDCLPPLLERARDECRRAARADHVRQFQWTIDAVDRHWTFLLLPVYSTYYRDDEGVARRLLIHGGSGRMAGERRASPRRARRMALILAALALLLLLLGATGLLLGRRIDPLLPAGVFSCLAGLCTGLGALYPLVRVWRFNRRSPDPPLH